MFAPMAQDETGMERTPPEEGAEPDGRRAPSVGQRAEAPPGAT
ncbi:hypothetical protein [Cereibacter azotoformans]|nr:hypothetical protein [Cereibacter azotoformans]